MLRTKVGVKDARRPIRNAEDMLPLLDEIAKLHQEHFIVVSVDTKHRLINKRIVFVGTMTAVLVHPREVFVDAIRDRAAAIILSHNHPDGEPEPSEVDISITKELIAAGKLLGIEVLDHVIMAEDSHYSFKEQGALGL